MRAVLDDDGLNDVEDLRQVSFQVLMFPVWAADHSCCCDFGRDERQPASAMRYTMRRTSGAWSVCAMPEPLHPWFVAALGRRPVEDQFQSGFLKLDSGLSGSCLSRPGRRIPPAKMVRINPKLVVLLSVWIDTMR